MRCSVSSIAMAIIASGYCIGNVLGSTVILSNNGLPGDSFTNPSPPNTGQAVGGSGFYYNNVRNSGTVGINSTYARSGNGSAFMSTVDGGSKADFELLPDAILFSGNYFPGIGASLGRLGDLTALSYEWYRDSASGNGAVQHPVVRLLVETATGARGGLVFEQAYNGSSVPTDTWVFEDIFSYNAGDGANLWSFAAGMTNFEFGFNNSLTDWVNGVGTIDADTKVIGISMGVGSGWAPGAFIGAVDNLTIGFNGVNTSYNFEVIPSPGTIALLGLGGLMAARRRR